MLVHILRDSPNNVFKDMTSYHGLPGHQRSFANRACLRRAGKATAARGEAAQTVAKPGLTARKVLLCIWWDWKGIIYYELLPYDQTLNSDIYCQQLDRLKLAIEQKRPELTNRRSVAFHQDKIRSQTSVVTFQKLWELGGEVLMHSTYSPCLAPSDYRLFLQLQNIPSDKKLESREDCENLDY
ncbi:mariner Mos1 transposase [Trichonephila clavipes]|nr:mariner Mos1 transposase [Trichonephila clavipes]